MVSLGSFTGSKLRPKHHNTVCSHRSLPQAVSVKINVIVTSPLLILEHSVTCMRHTINRGEIAFSKTLHNCTYIYYFGYSTGFRQEYTILPNETSIEKHA
jgi:hypothetical protein